MPILGFNKQFADAVRTGRKSQTIRAKRKRPIKVGDALYCYTGLMRPGAEKLAVGFVVSVEEISIAQVNASGELLVYVELDGKLLQPEAVEKLAVSDGFDNGKAFLHFFIETYGAEFAGDLIKWKPAFCYRCDLPFDSKFIERFGRWSRCCDVCQVRNLHAGLGLPTPPELLDRHTKRPALTQDDYKKQLRDLPDDQ